MSGCLLGKPKREPANRTGRYRIRALGLALIGPLVIGGCGSGGDAPPHPSPEPPSAATCQSDITAVEPRCVSLLAPALPNAIGKFLLGAFSERRRFDFANLGYDARAYPSEAAVVFWSGYQLTGDPEYLRAGRDQLAYAATLVDAQGFFDWPFQDLGRYSSNTMARLSLGFYMGYLATGDPAWLEYSERVAGALMTLPEANVVSTFSGASYQLPYYVYQSPTEAASGRTLDPNQDASLALLFTLLANDSSSRLFRNAAVVERSVRYLAAAMAMLHDDTCWPLADQDGYRDVCDSLYNWWTLYQLNWANQVSPNTELTHLLSTQYQILRSDLLAGNTRRIYPSVYNGPLTNPTELWLALPPALQYGSIGDARRIVELIGQQAENNPGWVAMPGGFVVGYGIRGQYRP